MANQPKLTVREGEWPADGLERVDVCPVCGTRERHTLHGGLTDRVFGSAPGTWTLVRCDGCASAYLDPRPTPETLGLAYATYYTHGDAAAPEGPVLGGLRRGLANDYLFSRWGYDAQPRASGGRLIPRIAPSRGAIVDREIRHLPARPGGRLLDVGSGDGAFVAAATQRGWRAEGLEPDPAAVAGARALGREVEQGTLKELAERKPGERYDAITLSHVVEHMHDPEGELAAAFALLRPGGLLWIATPNLESLGHRRFGADWLGLDPPRHLVIFTPESLAMMLRGIGFVVEPTPRPAPQVWASFSNSAAIRDGRPYQHGPASGRRRLRALAALADVVSARDPRHADELLAVARREIR
jgi:2-polyprenyl-3-methyl-5-hydroxy-6-metoxy-1,4-benzoquinol methylase